MKDQLKLLLAYVAVFMIVGFFIFSIGRIGYMVGRDEAKSATVELTPVQPELQWEEVYRGLGIEALKALDQWPVSPYSEVNATAVGRWSIERRKGPSEAYPFEWRYVSWPQHYKLIMEGRTGAPWIKGVESPTGPWELWQRDDGSYVFVNN